jgi:hypothetical protein
MQTESLEGACDYADAPVNTQSLKYAKQIKIWRCALPRAGWLMLLVASIKVTSG